MVGAELSFGMVSAGAVCACPAGCAAVRRRKAVSAGTEDVAAAAESAPETTSAETPVTDAAAPRLPDLTAEQESAQGSPTSIDLLKDVEMNVKIELGRTKMLVEDVLRLGEGSIVEIDKLAGDPVDVYVNDRLVARGEVLVLNDDFCVRISQIVVDHL